MRDISSRVRRLQCDSRLRRPACSHRSTPLGLEWDQVEDLPDIEKRVIESIEVLQGVIYGDERTVKKKRVNRTHKTPQVLRCQRQREGQALGQPRKT